MHGIHVLNSRRSARPPHRRGQVHCLVAAACLSLSFGAAAMDQPKAPEKSKPVDKSKPPDVTFGIEWELTNWSLVTIHFKDGAVVFNQIRTPEVDEKLKEIDAKLRQVRAELDKFPPAYMHDNLDEEEKAKFMPIYLPLESKAEALLAERSKLSAQEGPKPDEGCRSYLMGFGASREEKYPLVDFTRDLFNERSPFACMEIVTGAVPHQGQKYIDDIKHVLAAFQKVAADGCPIYDEKKRCVIPMSTVYARMTALLHDTAALQPKWAVRKNRHLGEDADPANYMDDVPMDGHAKFTGKNVTAFDGECAVVLDDAMFGNKSDPFGKPNTQVNIEIPLRRFGQDVKGRLGIYFGQAGEGPRALYERLAQAHLPLPEGLEPGVEQTLRGLVLLYAHTINTLAYRDAGEDLSKAGNRTWQSWYGKNAFGLLHKSPLGSTAHALIANSSPETAKVIERFLTSVLPTIDFCNKKDAALYADELFRYSGAKDKATFKTTQLEGALHLFLNKCQLREKTYYGQFLDRMKGLRLDDHEVGDVTKPIGPFVRDVGGHPSVSLLMESRTSNPLTDAAIAQASFVWAPYFTDEKKMLEYVGLVSEVCANGKDYSACY